MKQGVARDELYGACGVPPLPGSDDLSVARIPGHAPGSAAAEGRLPPRNPHPAPADQHLLEVLKQLGISSAELNTS